MRRLQFASRLALCACLTACAVSRAPAAVALPSVPGDIYAGVLDGEGLRVCRVNGAPADAWIRLVWPPALAARLEREMTWASLDAAARGQWEVAGGAQSAGTLHPAGQPSRGRAYVEVRATAPPAPVLQPDGSITHEVPGPPHRVTALLLASAPGTGPCS